MQAGLWLRWKGPDQAASGLHPDRASATHMSAYASGSSRGRQRDQPHLALWGGSDHDPKGRDPHVYPFSTYKRSIGPTFHDAWLGGKTAKLVIFLKFCRANVYSRRI